MKTYRLKMVREQDGALFGIKAFEARDDHHAAEIAERLCSRNEDRFWDGQRLRVELTPTTRTAPRALVQSGEASATLAA